MDNENTDWFKKLCTCFNKFPKKIKIEIKMENSEQIISSKKFDSTCYGNINLIFPWSLDILEGKIERYQMALQDGQEADLCVFQECSTYFQFNFNLREYYDDIRSIHGAQAARSKLKSIYTCCLFYEIMSLGHYVPNLFQDQARIHPCSLSSENSTRVPLATLLFATLNDCYPWEDLEDLDYCNISPNFDGPACLWLSSDKFMEIIESIYFDFEEKEFNQLEKETFKAFGRIDGQKKETFKAFGRIDGQSPFFYFDAGGVIEEVIHNVSFEIVQPQSASSLLDAIDEEGKKSIVKVTRQEARSFF
ncbi:predicted protein [Naegleria gruberi]|uniref:Predicted protein n=1 Tax=Naegleria gruberi TaxID=5762 RepID=D2VZ83_NAEGR|nr:uncharacterized protein NAEGRDRAFT_74397 [Naegleria gruberi]EFC37896.1 predicted protein [Naegleria gruberi]|eukprot:XP_002670640.1 predicted protein [Naegleria gruberi strain NEG-M]